MLYFLAVGCRIMNGISLQNVPFSIISNYANIEKKSIHLSNNQPVICKFRPLNIFFPTHTRTHTCIGTHIHINICQVRRWKMNFHKFYCCFFLVFLLFPPFFAYICCNLHRSTIVILLLLLFFRLIQKEVGRLWMMCGLWDRRDWGVGETL